MSMIWLVAPDEKSTSDLTDFLSGLFAVRRIAGLLSLTRLLKLNEMRPVEGFLCLISIDSDHNLIEMHSGLSSCLRVLKPHEVTIVGNLTEEQIRLAKNFGLDIIVEPADYTEFSRQLKSKFQKQSRSAVSHVSENMIRVGDIEVDRDLARMRVLATGLEESLTPKEVRIMQVLTLSANKTIGRDELIGKVWAGVRVSTSTIDSHMSRLRRKIEQSFECRLETEYGSGWKLSVRDQ
jgi:DNA-binding response OmpR family regulator